MYWQKRLNKPNKDIEIEKKILILQRAGRKISGNKINRNFKVEKPYTKLFTDPNIFLNIAFFNSNATITYFAFAIVYFLIKYFTIKKRISK